MPRIVALTGTPGTGKTTIAQELSSRVTVVEAGRLATELDAIAERDHERGSDVVDEEILEQHARARLPAEGPVLVEGVLAHYCDPDAVVVLRCHPTVLRKRLSDRGWPPAKIDENVLAETLDAIVAELDDQPAWELDTTTLTPEEAAARIVGLFIDEALDPSTLQPVGTVDWTSTLMEGGEAEHDAA